MDSLSELGEAVMYLYNAVYGVTGKSCRGCKSLLCKKKYIGN